MHDIKQEIKGLRVALGGSCVHSSKTFLADVAQLVRSRWAGGGGAAAGAGASSSVGTGSYDYKGLN